MRKITESQTKYSNGFCESKIFECFVWKIRWKWKCCRKCVLKIAVMMIGHHSVDQRWDKYLNAFWFRQIAEKHQTNVSFKHITWPLTCCSVQIITLDDWSLTFECVNIWAFKEQLNNSENGCSGFAARKCFHLHILIEWTGIDDHSLWASVPTAQYWF